MDGTHQTDNEQAPLWNGLAGCAWVAWQESLDQRLQPFEDLLVDVVALGLGGRVLDDGGGTGRTTLAVARLRGAKGRGIGIDIADAMIAAAREGTPARCICANAQAQAFEPASFDRIMSRFGVMVFDDALRAFANLRRAAMDTAELRFVAWRSAAEHPCMTTAERAAAPLLPNLPARRTRRGCSPSRTATGSPPCWRKAAGPRAISGGSMWPAFYPQRRWSLP